MVIRDALESDAQALAALTGRPEDVMIDMIHDRSVRVAVPETEGSTGNVSSESEDETVVETGDDQKGNHGINEGDATGFIAFDVRGETVHVTDFGGTRSALERLFEEPRRYATRESMPLEVVVSEANDVGIDAVEAAGFERIGSGPRFDGHSTAKYRLDPTGST